MASLIFCFFEETVLFSMVALQFTFPLTVFKSSLFPTPFLACIICIRSDDGHSDRYEVVPHCGFDRAFL